MTVGYVIGTATVPQGDVEKSIRPESKGAAVVVALRLVDAKYFTPAVRIDPVRIIWIDQPF